MNKLIRTGFVALAFSILTIIGHYCGWGVEGSNNGWLLNSTYVAAVSGIFAGSGLTAICLGLPRRKNGQ